MLNRKNAILAAVFSVALSLTAYAQSPAQADPAPKAKDSGIQMLDMNGAPKLEFYKSLPGTKPADVAPTNTPTTPGTKTPAAPTTPGSVPPAVTTDTTAPVTVAPGTSPDITSDQIQKFLESHGMDAATALKAANPTPAMLDEEFMNIWTFIAQKYYNGDKLKGWEVWPAKYKGNLKTRDDLDKAVTAMFASLGDRWTTFTSIESMLRAQAQAKPDLEYLGIMLAKNANGTFRIEGMEYASPAWNANMFRPGDIVKAVQTVDEKTGAVTNHDLAGMSKEDASQLLVGKKGAKVVVVINHDGKDESVPLAFDDTPGEQVEVGMLPNNIGYVRLPSFGSSGDEANMLGNNFLRALIMLDANAHGNLKGLVLDLRANHGGVVDLAEKIARIFIEKGPFIQTQERQGGIDKIGTDFFRAPMAYEYVGMPPEVIALFARLHSVPMTVLVDGSSASSAEILTGTLKDNKRAVVIGMQTFGKAVAFVRIPMSTGMLQVTTMHYLTPSGYDLANKGIAPDIVIDRTRGDLSTHVDEQLVTAVQILTTASNTLTAPDPSATTQGEDDLFGGESLLMVGLGLGGILLAIVLTHMHFRYRKERDEQERKEKNERK